METTFISAEVFEAYKQTCDAKREVDEAKRQHLESMIETMGERIEGLESQQKHISEIATSVAVMSVSIDNLSKEVKAQNESLAEAIKAQNESVEKMVVGIDKRLQKNENEIEAIKLNPGDTFNKLKLACATTAIGGFIGALVSALMKMF